MMKTWSIDAADGWSAGYTAADALAAATDPC
jgi:hypothetical protein